MVRNWALAAVCFTTLGVPAQTLSPREIFYGQDRPEAKPAAKAKAMRTPHEHATAAKDHATVTEGVSERAAPSVDAAVSTPPATSAPATYAKTAPAMYVKTVARPERALGLKYEILQRTSEGDYIPTDPDATFVSGDRIRLNIEANDTAYLYVVTQGTSQVWKLLYPTPDMPDGSNRVQRGREYAVPDGSVFSFDSRAGTEKLFIVLSRDPEPDLERLIHSLNTNEPRPSENDHPMLTQNIENAFVQRLRNAYSRDLLIEKVNDAPAASGNGSGTAQDSARSPAPRAEKAVYVVNPTAQGRVVADIALRHE